MFGIRLDKSETLLITIPTGLATLLVHIHLKIKLNSHKPVKMPDFVDC